MLFRRERNITPESVKADPQESQTETTKYKAII